MSYLSFGINLPSGKQSEIYAYLAESNPDLIKIRSRRDNCDQILVTPEELLEVAKNVKRHLEEMKQEK